MEKSAEQVKGFGYDLEKGEVEIDLSERQIEKEEASLANDTRGQAIDLLNSKIILISDMHIGDGHPTEPFANKDNEFRRFLDHAHSNADILMIAGDGFDLAQAFNMGRIYKKHKPLIDDLQALSDAMPICCLEGNHDPLKSLQSFFHSFDFRQHLMIGDDICVEHGHAFDRMNQPSDRAAFWRARIHTFIEKTARAPVRIPMRKHYQWSVRLVGWLLYRYCHVKSLGAKFYELIGNEKKARRNLDFIDYWTSSEWGDNLCMLRPVEDFLDQSPITTLVCGHSHIPGIVQFPGGTYINLGSWAYQDATYTTYDQGNFLMQDWISGKVIEDEEYRGILGPNRNKSRHDWWKAFYRGFFRYDIEALIYVMLGEDPPNKTEEEVFKKLSIPETEPENRK